MPSSSNPPMPEGRPRVPRMRDVAELAGVGLMTVSRVLNGSAYVSEAVTLRVQQAVRELNYKPNPIAKAMRGSQSHSIGVIVPYLYDPMFASLAHAIGLVARQQGYSVNITAAHEEPELEVEEARRLSRHQVDGLILLLSDEGSARVSADPLLRTLPMVWIDRPDPSGRHDCILVDNLLSTCAAVDRLIAAGHRRIAFLAFNDDVYTLRQRRLGYEQAMHAAGLQPWVVLGGRPEQQMSHAIAETLRHRDRPTAFFAANALTVRACLRTIGEMSLRVPQDVALIGFDDFPLADMLQPSITAIAQPEAQLGQLAAEMLFARILASPRDPVAPPRCVQLPVHLVLRGSCGTAS